VIGIRTRIRKNFRNKITPPSYLIDNHHPSDVVTVDNRSITNKTRTCYSQYADESLSDSNAGVNRDIKNDAKTASFMPFLKEAKFDSTPHGWGIRRLKEQLRVYDDKTSRNQNIFTCLVSCRSRRK